MASGRVELRQSTGNVLQLPIFIAVVVLAIAVRQFVGETPSAIVVVVCVAAAALDLLFAGYLLRNTRSRLVVTADDITFTRRGDGKGAAPQVIHRAAGSTLSFRVARNGPMGSKYTGYTLKLRDDATGSEVFAGAFGRQKVQQAAESQDWSFS